MIKFESLTLENFGCYRDRMHVQFSKNGVNLFIGQNGTGKTTFMYALQYLLTDKVIKSETSIPRNIIDLIYTNQEFFELVLRLEKDSDHYVITKKVSIDKKNKGIVKISKNVQKNDIIMGESEKIHFLQNVLHPDIAQFFILDAMSLKRFSPDSSAETVGQQVKAQLEVLMGLPAIVESRNAINEKYEVIKKELNKKKKKLITSEDKLRSISDVEKDIDDAKKSKEETEAQLRTAVDRIDRYKELIEDNIQMTTKCIELEQKEKQEKDNQEEILLLMEESSLAQNIWLPLILTNWLKKQDELLTHEITELGIKRAMTENEVIKEFLKSSISKSVCEICGSMIDSPEKSLIEEKLKKLVTVATDESLVHEESKLRNTHNLVKQLLDSSKQAEISLVDRIENIYKLNQKKEKLKEEISRLIVEVGNADKDSLMTANNNYLQAKTSVEYCQKAIDQLSHSLSSNEEKRSQLIAMASTADFRQDENKQKALLDIVDVLNKAIENLKQDLRAKIQQGASEVFVKMNPKSSYKSLKIDPDRYTLTPVTQNGEPYSQTGLNSANALLTAFSFLASLHANSPIKGPLVIDSAFDPLDGPTTENFLAQIPNVTEQVLVLCTSKSLKVDNQQLKKIWGLKLSKMFELVRTTGEDKTMELSYITEIHDLPTGVS